MNTLRGPKDAASTSICSYSSHTHRLGDDMVLHTERRRSFQAARACWLAGAFAIATFLSIAQADAQRPGAQQQQLALDIFRELIEIDTTTQTGEHATGR
jgi:hypothetical protein